MARKEDMIGKRWEELEEKELTTKNKYSANSEVVVKKKKQEDKANTTKSMQIDDGITSHHPLKAI